MSELVAKGKAKDLNLLTWLTLGGFPKAPVFLFVIQQYRRGQDTANTCLEGGSRCHDSQEFARDDFSSD